ncbi:MAG TPA: lysophospholipid acyltransferase family protein [Silvibacterium sp.]|jgi:1-acyl-sn-glycerol-3-phosphate acyltransferase|nr:lysophospholipid acyltransferase family protein [Silvibacterium sp.]
MASIWDKNGKGQHAIARLWGRTIVFLSGARVTKFDTHRLDGRVAVYVANHLSYMDTPVIFSALPFQFRIVARHDLFSLPFIGWHLRRSGQVPVNVTNPRASISSLGGAVKTLRAGMPLFIFPEGGRSATGHLETLMNGPAFMAIRTGLPIVPMALIGTYELLPMHSRELHPVPVTLVVGEPIESTGYSMKRIDELTARISEELCRLYYRYSYLEQPAKLELEAITVATMEGEQQ